MRIAALVLVTGIALAPWGALHAEDEPLPPSPEGVLNRGPVREITLLEAIQMALRSNLDLQAGRVDPRMAAAGYEAERAVFDPLLSGEFNYQHNETPSTSSFFGRPVVTENVFNASAGVSQMLPSGGTVGFLYRADFFKTDSSFITFSPTHTNTVGFQASQPLLRGAGDVVLSNIRTAHNDVVAARENLRTLRENTVLQVVNAYWDLVRLQEELKAFSKSEKTAAELLRDAGARLDAKVGTPLDVAEAEAGVEARRGTRITAEGALSRQQDLLRTLIMPFTPDDATGIRFVATDDVERATTRDISPAQIQSYVDLALSRRPEIHATKAQLANRDIDVTVAANAILPQLDVVGSIGTTGLEGSLGGAFTNMTQAQGVNGAVGLKFSMFIGQRAARSRFRLSQWARRQIVIRYKQLENGIVQQVRDGVRVTATARAVLETAKAQVTAAEEDLRGEGQKLLQGKSTPFDVLLKEDSLTAARLRLATAGTELRKAEAGLWRAVGMLGETLGVGR